MSWRKVWKAFFYRRFLCFFSWNHMKLRHRIIIQQKRHKSTCGSFSSEHWQNPRGCPYNLTCWNHEAEGWGPHKRQVLNSGRAFCVHLLQSQWYWRCDDFTSKEALAEVCGFMIKLDSSKRVQGPVLFASVSGLSHLVSVWQLPGRKVFGCEQGFKSL